VKNSRIAQDSERNIQAQSIRAERESKLGKWEPERGVTVTIRAEHEQLIAQAIETGNCQSPDEVIGRALEILRSEDEWIAENKSAAGEKIERAFGQFERGEFFSPEQSKDDMEKRKAEWLSRQGG
jgi:Arc/MetJ-type ribon-helix-helix transcriptional regulator